MIDKTALREAFINAIVHNDYTREVTPLVEIFSNRLVITSYGGLVEGLSIDEFFSGRSMPRNRELMRIFHDLEFVGHLGSGMHRILHAYNKTIFQISDNFISIVFPFVEEYLRLTEQVNMQDNMLTDSDSNELTMQVTIQDTMQVKELVNSNFVLGDTAMKGLKTWKNLYIHVLSIYRKKDPARFSKLHLNERFIRSRGNPLFSKTGKELRIAEKLADDFYLKVNLSANMICNNIRVILDYFGDKPMEMRVYLREDRDAE